jgi:uncharacterized protein (DUF2141 family)
MKKFSFIFFVALFINVLYSFSQFTLTVEISGLRNNKGQLHYELFDEKKVSLKTGTIEIANQKALFVFENMKVGKYAFNFIHDENKNKKLDTILFFIPREGFGFSNNPVLRFGPPDFKELIFDVKENTKIKCKAIYLNYKQ